VNTRLRLTVIIGTN